MFLLIDIDFLFFLFFETSWDRPLTVRAAGGMEEARPPPGSR